MSAGNRNDTGAEADTDTGADVGIDADDSHQLRAFLTTFQTYVTQQHEAGTRWYLDAGPPESESPPAVVAPDAASTAVDAAPVAPDVAPAAPRTAAPGAEPTASPPPVKPLPPGDSRQVEATAGRQTPLASEQVFDDACAVFVRDTLAHIARYREAVPAQGDIFTVKDETPSLDPAAKQTALAELAAEVAACRLCKLHDGRTQTVFGAGNSDADLVLIGEAPGVEEDRQGLPFVGRSGQLLTEILKAIGFAREDVYICNILKCRPPQNRDPEREEVSSCEAYLQRQLEIIEPRIILCLGRVAAQTLLGTTATLGALRESVHFYVGIPVMATYHPAALLRNAHMKRPCWDDVRKVRALHDALR